MVGLWGCRDGVVGDISGVGDRVLLVLLLLVFVGVDFLVLGR